MCGLLLICSHNRDDVDMLQLVDDVNFIDNSVHSLIADSQIDVVEHLMAGTKVGRIKAKTCGKTMCRQISGRGIAKARAASICPRGTAVRPPRIISDT